MLAEHLDQLSRSFPDCVLSAFVDIRTGIVLLTNEHGSDLREVADALCAEAALSLGGVTAPVPDTSTCAQVIKSDADYLHIYLRSENEATEALLCRCQPSLALDTFLPAARDCLARLSEQGKS